MIRNWHSLWFGSRRGFWISLLIPLYFGGMSLAYRLEQFPIVQDDQRLHLVWLQQWFDPQLFQNDWIAQYYQSIQPIGFRTFYWIAAQVGVEPMTLAIGLPLILALLSSIFLYRVTFRLLPHPLAPLLAVLLLNQNIWCKDDLVSASPRSFVYLLLLLFLDAVVRLPSNSSTLNDFDGSEVPPRFTKAASHNRGGGERIQPAAQRQFPLKLTLWCLLVLGLQGLFYPQIMLVSLGVLWLQLLQWQNGKLRLSRDRSRYMLAVAGLLLTGIVLLLFSQNASAFGEIFTATQMRSMPEFQPGGRRVYFGVNPLRFWFAGASGLRFPLFPPILWAAIGLPLMLIRAKRKQTLPSSKIRPPSPSSLRGTKPDHSETQSPPRVGDLGGIRDLGSDKRAQLKPSNPPCYNPKNRIVPLIQPQIIVLAQVTIASVALFGLAHLTFPLLYLPSRYTFYSSRVVMSIAAAVTLTVLIDRFWQWLRFRQRAGFRLRDRIVTTSVVLFAIVAVVLPAIPPLFLSNQGWITASQTELYTFLKTQPENTVIASLSPITDNIPAFSQRSVLFSPELALPYHSGFYEEMEQRITDVVQAQYSADVSEVKSTIEKHNIRLWIVETKSFHSDYLLSQSWLMNSSMRSIVQQTIEETGTSLQQGKRPVLQTFSQPCSVFSENDYSVIDTNCVVQHLNPNA